MSCGMIFIYPILESKSFASTQSATDKWQVLLNGGCGGLCITEKIISLVIAI